MDINMDINMDSFGFPGFLPRTTTGHTPLQLGESKKKKEITREKGKCHRKG
jgi:hypothetical protein